MKQEPQHDIPTQVQQQVNAALEQQVNDLDELTLAKLKSARLQAMQQMKPSWSQRINQLMTAPLGLGGACAVILVVMVSINWQTQPELNISADELAAYMNPVLTEDPDMLTDLEFFAWLEDEQLLEEGKRS